jgi:integrase
MGSLYRRTPKGKYYGEFTTADGRRIRRSTGTTVKQDAARILAKWEEEENNLRHGIVKPTELTLETLLKEYLAYRGGSRKHLQHMESKLRVLFSASGWTRANQINQYQLEVTVRNLIVAKTGKPASARTRGHYLAAAKAFTRWLGRVRKVIHSDPLLELSKPKVEADRRLVRRFLLPEEWQWLAKTPNATLYQTAIQTGFRASELLELKPQHLGKDHLWLPAKYTKNKLDAKQYITADLQAKLQGVLPFEVPDRQRLASLLRTDLVIARDLYLDQGPSNKPVGFLQPLDAVGHVLDFHALRHTCGAWLAIAGVNPKVIQSVMRHSSITLTLDTYGHLLPGAEQDAIQHFDRFMAVDL